MGWDKLEYNINYIKYNFTHKVEKLKDFDGNDSGKCKIWVKIESFKDLQELNKLTNTGIFTPCSHFEPPYDNLQIDFKEKEIAIVDSYTS